MRDEKQIELLIESLKFRLKQLKESKELTLSEDLLYVSCPLCKARRKSFNGCEGCIGQTFNICQDYGNLVRDNDKRGLITWLKDQIEEWSNK